MCVLSVYTPQKGMEKLNFLESLLSTSANVGIDLFFYHKNFTEHKSQVAAGYEGLHGSFHFGLGNDTYTTIVENER